MSDAGRRAFIQRVAAQIEWGLLTHQSPREIAERVASKSVSPPRMVGPLKKLLVECGFEPVCWLCNLRIYLDEVTDDYAAISQDHVIPRSAGGTKNDDNIRLAHRICNSTRGCARLKNKTIKKMEAMRVRLLARMEKELEVAC